MIESGVAKAPKLWRRMACFLYEGMMLFGLGLIPGAVGALLKSTFDISDAPWIESGLRVLTFAVYASYFTWCWSRRGQTLPMQTWHIQVVTLKGQLLTQKQAFLRFLACWIWIAPSAIICLLGGFTRWQAIACVLVGFTVYASLSYLHPRKQFWHDAWCGTQLISK